jgi:hypothetical protein
MRLFIMCETRANLIQSVLQKKQREGEETISKALCLRMPRQRQYDSSIYANIMQRVNARF